MAHVFVSQLMPMKPSRYDEPAETAREKLTHQAVQRFHGNEGKDGRLEGDKCQNRSEKMDVGLPDECGSRILLGEDCRNRTKGQEPVRDFDTDFATNSSRRFPRETCEVADEH
jgi:hypothetical protein